MNFSIAEDNILDVATCVSLVVKVDGSDDEEVKKKAFLHQGFFKMKIPRLLVNDIRKLYSEMLMNIFNSADFPMLFGFLDTYCVRNVQYRISRFNRLDSKKEFSLNINGIFELSKYWYSIFRMSPDNVLKVFDVRYIHSSGTILCKAYNKGSYIYEFAQNTSYYAPYLFVDKKYGSAVLYANDKTISDFVVGRKDRVECSTMQDCHASKEELMKSITDSIDMFVSKLPLRKVPLVVHTEATCTIDTDECKRITGIELCGFY